LISLLSAFTTAMSSETERFQDLAWIRHEA
jgi:hypothetical protein